MITIDLANEANDDWLKKANPNYRASEDQAHAEALAAHERVSGTKQAADYTIAMPSFFPDPWPSALDLEMLLEEVHAGVSWANAIARYKATHQLVEGQWQPLSPQQ